MRTFSVKNDAINQKWVSKNLDSRDYEIKGDEIVITYFNESQKKTFYKLYLKRLTMQSLMMIQIAIVRAAKAPLIIVRITYWHSMGVIIATSQTTKEALCRQYVTRPKKWYMKKK